MSKKNVQTSLENLVCVAFCFLVSTFIVFLGCGLNKFKLHFQQKRLVHGQQINNFNYFRSCNLYLQHKEQNICKRLLGRWQQAFLFFFMDYNMLHPPKKSPVDDYHGRHWPVGMAPLECWQRKSKTSHSRNGPKGTTSMTHSQAVRSVPRSIEKL